MRNNTLAYGDVYDGSNETPSITRGPPPQRQRRRRVLERNRLAATKCRTRKRDEASALAAREQEMEDDNRYLASVYDALTAEIYELKTQLLRHTECGCVLIQRYIASEAKRSVDNLVNGSGSAASSSIDGYNATASRSSSISAPPSLSTIAEACHNHPCHHHQHHHIPSAPSIPLPATTMMEPTTPDELMCPIGPRGSIDSATLQSPAESDGIQTPWTTTPAAFPLGPPLASRAPMQQINPDTVLDLSEGLYGLTSMGIPTGSEVHPMMPGILPPGTPGGLSGGCGPAMLMADVELPQHVPIHQTGWITEWNCQ
jgi:hypothetical protein